MKGNETRLVEFMDGSGKTRVRGGGLPLGGVREVE